jgi:WD40 repeat protein/formylglycine-generating enzyme required for sulfatase activity
MKISLVVFAICASLVVVGRDRAEANPAPARTLSRVGDTWTNSLGMTFSYIPAGNFEMGSPATEAGRAANETQHKVTITQSFLLGATPVTVGQFSVFAKESGYQTQAERNGWGFAWDGTTFRRKAGASWRNPGFPQTDDHPVVEISWNDAVAFSDWLSDKERITYRLPTEAQWEYACRAGSTTAYPWGANVSDAKAFANLPDMALNRLNPSIHFLPWDDGSAFTSPVGKFKPNAFGLYDMVGNVREWCSDVFAPYTDSATSDPQGPPAQQNDERLAYPPQARVLRGSSFIFAACLRSAARSMAMPDDYNVGFGFRLAMDPNPAAIAHHRFTQPPTVAVAAGGHPTSPHASVVPTAQSAAPPATGGESDPTPAAAPTGTAAAPESGPELAANLEKFGPANTRPTGLPPAKAACVLVAQTGHALWVNAACYSPDARQAVTGGHDGTAVLWDTLSGRELRRFVGHTDEVISVCFSPNGQQILTGSKDRTARLWDAATGKELMLFDQRNEPGLAGVFGICFVANGKHLVTRHEDVVVDWDIATGKEIRRWNWFSPICISPDEKTVLTLSLEDNFPKSARLLDVVTGNQLQVLHGHTDQLNCACFSPDGTQVLTGSNDRTARLWDVATGKELQRYVSLTPVNFVCFSPDGRRVLTGSNVVQLWDAQSGMKLQQLLAPASAMAPAHFSLDGTQVLTLNGLWDAGTGKELRGFQFVGHAAAVHSVCCSSDGKQVLAGGLDKSAHLWDLSTGKEVRRFFASNFLNGVSFSPDGKKVVTGDSNGMTKAWDTATGKQLSEAYSVGGIINFATFGQTGDHILVANSQFAQLIDVKSGKIIGVFGHKVVGDDIYAACLSPDGKQVVTAGTTTRLWDVATGNELKRFGGYADLMQSVCFSPDGAQVLTGGDDCTARLWDVRTGTELRRFEGHTNGVSAVYFCSDAKHVLTGSGDGTTRLWDVATGKELCSLISFTDGTCAVVAPDGRYDAPNGGEANWLHWVFSDHPFTPLGIDVFLRDYYEPRLLPRILANNGTTGGDFKPVRALQDIDREQPQVGPIRVEREGQSDRVDVVVSVKGTPGNVLRGGKPQSLNSVHDLRLFRDGMLVAQSPAPTDALIPNGVSDQELQGWDQATKVAIDPSGTVTFHDVALPHRAGTRAGFTAYAFNADRVKSDTARANFLIPADLSPRTPKAYVLAMGVNQSQSPDFVDLQFAAADAALIHDSLAPRLVGYDVVPVLLISTAQHPDDADKANLQAAMQTLAGQPPDPAIASRLPAECRKLARATPDDLVLLSFSGHGCTVGGEFYLIPSDIGAGHTRMREPSQWLPKLISAEELSRWLRRIDAGQMALVIDACYSAAAVEQSGFKPGPLGNRGLGQLAYDKRMRVLAASQSDGVAVETQQVHHGLLTWALVHDGLVAGQASSTNASSEADGPLVPVRTASLGQVMQYASERVPTLYLEMRNHKINTFGLTNDQASAFGLVVAHKGEPNPQPTEGDNAQHPALFDFADPRLDTQIRTGT